MLKLLMFMAEVYAIAFFEKQGIYEVSLKNTEDIRCVYLRISSTSTTSSGIAVGGGALWGGEFPLQYL